MYRQVELVKEQQQLQRIFWRTSPDEPLRQYQIQRVIYGLASSGYVSVKAMNKCGADHVAEFPLAKKAIEESLYMDDLLVSTNTIEMAKELRRQIIDIFAVKGLL